MFGGCIVKMVLCVEFVDKLDHGLGECLVYSIWWPTLEFVDKFRPCLGECTV